MAVPVITSGTIVSGTGSLSPTLPAHVADDILFCAYATEDNTATLSAPAGWTAIPASQPNTTGIRMSAWWRRVGSGETVATPSLTKSTGTGASLAVAARVRGVRATGNPWAASPLSFANASATTVSFGGGLTTTVADTLLVQLVANSTDTSTSQTSAYRAATDPVQANWSEDADTNVNTATGAGLAMAHATKTTAGATGNLNATLATASVSAAIAFELIPEAGQAETANVDDTASITDAVATSYGNVDAVADTASVTDAVATAVDHVLVLADGFDMADAPVTATAYARSVADGADAADAAAAGLLRAVSLGDAATATDGIASTSGTGLAIADGLVIADSVAAFDSFTDADNTLLDAHVGEGGVGWVKHPLYAPDAKILANSVRPVATNNASLHMASVPPDSPDYDVVMNFAGLSLADRSLPAVCGRIVPNADTYLFGRLDTASGAHKLQLFKQVASAATSLGIFNTTFTLSTLPEIRLRMVGDQVSLLADGVVVIGPVTVADAALQNAGRWGVRTGQVTNVFSSTGVHIADVKLDPGGPVRALSMSRAIADSAQATDAVSTAAARAMALTDAAGATDQLTAARALATALGDVAAMTDSTASQTSLARAIADTAQATDSIDPQKTSGLFLTLRIDDALGGADALSMAAAWNRTIADSAAATDGVGTQSHAVLLLSDSLTVDDVVSNAREVALAVDDALAIADDVSTVEDLRLLLEDAGTLRDLAPGDPVVGAEMASRGIGLRFDDALAATDDVETTLARATRVLIYQTDRSVVTIALAEDAARAAVGDRALVMLVIGARRAGLIHEANKEDE